MNPMYREEGDIQGIVEKFEGCDFKLEEFTHTRHLAVAAWYLIHFDAGEALARMRSGLQRFITHHGKQGYHETITRFWMELMGSYLGEIPENVSLTHKVNLVITDFGSKDILGEYYTRERVMSETAKRDWVEPDLKCIFTKNAGTPRA